MKEKNTPELWDNCWSQEKSQEEDQYDLAKEERSIRYQRIESILLHQFNKLEGLRIIEIGAGAGTNAALLARKGADVTILDYSEKALLRSKNFFSRNDLQAEFISANALDLPINLLHTYDVAMSFGLSEHFSGKERIQINRSHFDLLKKDGVAIISVPNSHNFPYRIFKFIAEALGQWNVGEEYPYTRKEFTQICAECNIENYSFIGDSIYWSFNFINPLKYLNRLMIKIFGLRKNYDVSRIRVEKGSPLDQYFSYALVLCAFNNKDV